MDNWISVEDELPSKNGEVLAITRRGDIFIAGVNATTTPEGWRTYFANTHIECGHCDKITHWMPLPALPKESPND